MIKLKWYFAKAISENKTNLEMMVKRTWGIYKHKASTNEEPYHEWYDPKCCGYWKSLQLGEDYDHSSHALPPAVMKAVKPVCQELASEENLKRVLNGSTQNPNESFHALLWSMAPKNRYSSGQTIDICLGLGVMIFNDGHQSLTNLLQTILGGGVGYFTIMSLKRIDKARIYTKHKETIRKIKQKTAIVNNDDDSDFDSNDVDVLYSMMDNSDDYVPGEY
ncbi:unnamed protein product [Didymodactylos carnosus]|uniref:Uncharacterized protein n=1 Tax=Didymodactylos carnosus TaxID=1234261 RepID=A0A8S2F632_9BILA|nr:unnamed protein product [Didymodactylos carnosus]CAF4149330.1 unnamed protein product [Didymodactylos carnosus]